MWTSLDLERYAPGPFNDGRGLAALERWTAARAVALSPDGSLLAFGGGETYERKPLRAHRAVIVLVDAATGREVRRLGGHTDAVTALSFSADGRWLCSASAVLDGTARRWDVATGRCVGTFHRKPSPSVAVACLDDGRTVVASAGTLSVLTDRFKPAAEITREGRHVDSLAASAGGARVVTIHGGRVPTSPDARPSDGAFVAWDLSTGSVAASRAVEAPVAVAISHDGESAAVVEAPDAPPSAEATRAAAARLYNSGMFHPVERYLDPRFPKRVSVLAVPSLSPRWTLDLGSHVQSVAFSPDGSELVLVGRRGDALVLLRVSAADGAVREERTHPDPVRCDVSCLALGAGVVAAGTYYRVARFDDR